MNFGFSQNSGKSSQTFFQDLFWGTFAFHCRTKRKIKKNKTQRYPLRRLLEQLCGQGLSPRAKNSRFCGSFVKALRPLSKPFSGTIVFHKTYGNVWKLSTQNVTPQKYGNNDGDRTFLESHVLSILPLSPFLGTPI